MLYAAKGTLVLIGGLNSSVHERFEESILFTHLLRKMAISSLPVGLSSISGSHRILTVPQDGDCALHVIMKAMPKSASSVKALRLALSARVKPDTFRDYIRMYMMTAAPHIRIRMLACRTAECLRTILNHSSYYLANEDLVELGVILGFYPIIVNQMYKDQRASDALKETLLLCDPFNVHESSLRTRFLGAEIPGILFYNRSDIAHYECLQYNRRGIWTNLITVDDLDVTLSTFVRSVCTVSMDENKEQTESPTMDGNVRYRLDLEELVSHGYTIRRTEQKHGESVSVQNQDGHPYMISVSRGYPVERPTVLQGDRSTDVSSFWTPDTTLLELVQPSPAVEARYRLYANDKRILRSDLLRAVRRFDVQIPGLTRMLRLALCMHLAKFEITHQLAPFTQELEDDVLIDGFAELSVL